MPTAISIAELALLAATCRRSVELVRRADLRRIAPTAHTALFATLGGGAAVALGLALWAPAALHVLAAGAATLWVACAYRAHPGFGRRRGLPPGSLSLADSVVAIVDRDFYRARFERHGPIFKMSQFHRGAICVQGIQRGLELLREKSECLGPGELPFSRDIPGGFVRYMAGATYERYGTLLRGSLAGPVVRAAEPEIRATIRCELGRLADECERSPERGVPPGEAFDCIVLAAFLRVLFGLSRDSPEFAECRRLYEKLRLQHLGRGLTAETRATLDSFRTVIRKRAREFRRDEDDRSASSALEALVRAEPVLPDDTLVDNLVFILKISSANVTSLLHWIVKLVGEHPEWTERLRDGDSRELAGRIVKETLRLEQSEYLYRSVRETFTWNGFVFPRGWLVRVCVKESHRDETVFDDAARFDPDRWIRRPIGRDEYSPFGGGPHACNGIDLSNAISEILVEELARGFDWSIADDGPLERDFRHWSHWRPSSRLRLSIERRVATQPAGRSGAGSHA